MSPSDPLLICCALYFLWGGYKSNQIKCCCSCCCCCWERKTGDPRRKILAEQSREPANSVHIFRRVRNRTCVTLAKGECSVLNLKHREFLTPKSTHSAQYFSLLFWGELVHVGVEWLVRVTLTLTLTLPSISFVWLIVSVFFFPDQSRQTANAWSLLTKNGHHCF